MTLDVTKPMQYRSGEHAGAIRYVGELKPDQQIFAVQSDCEFEHIEKRFANGRVSVYGGQYPGDIINVPNPSSECKTAEDVVARIRAAHWDVVACNCWVCQLARTIGIGAYSHWLSHNHNNRRRYPVPGLGWEPLPKSPRTQGDDGQGGHT